MGKPKKQHSKDTQKELLGKKILCIAMIGAIYQCQHCLRVKKKGMFVEYDKKLYCTYQCVENSIKAKD